MSDILRALGDELPPEAVAEGPSPGVGGAPPGAEVAPATPEEVARALAVAGRLGVGVVPVGRLTDPGPEPPRGPYLALSTRRMAGVTDYEPADLTVTAGAGTGLDELARALAARGQWLPADPPRLPRRTVGGLVAAGAAGPLGTAFGAPRDLVLGLTAVAGDGRVLRLGGRVMKNVAGFDLVKLMVGSRGTLGVVTSASFRLFPRPAADRAYVVDASAPGDLLEVARGVATGRVVPASAVLVAGAPAAPGSAALVVRLQGAPAAVEADARTLLGGALGRARVLDGDEATALLEAVRDQGAEHPLVVRAFALPGLLPEALAAVGGEAPPASLAADVLSGRVRGGWPDASAVAPAALRRLRARLEALGGTLVLERCPPAVLGEVPARGDGGRAGALGSALRRHFDPSGVLSPGRFTP